MFNAENEPKRIHRDTQEIAREADQLADKIKRLQRQHDQLVQELDEAHEDIIPKVF